jgi:protein translocase SecG subunit
LSTYLSIAQIILAASLIAVILLQTRGTSILGGGGGISRTRRGVERTLFKATIGLSAALFVISLINVILTR